MLRHRRLLRFVGIATVLFAIYYLHGQPGFSSPSQPQLNIVKSGFDWSEHIPRNSISSIKPLPLGKPNPLPPIQHKFPKPYRAHNVRQEPRKQAVKDATQKCWQSYKSHAWMRDELRPLSGGGKDTYGGWAATLVDTLDTLWIMDLKKEFHEGVEAVITLDWANTTDTACNMFETTIRHLGGLLSAYDLSGERALLDKATELGDMLYAGFDTPNRMPGFWLDFKKAKMGSLIADDYQPSASSGSLSLEMTRLSQLTGDPKYFDAIDRVTAVFAEFQMSTQLPGMWPIFVDMRNLIFDRETTFTLGALADSLYEYLPKMYALLGGLDPVYGRMYKESIKVIKDHLLFRPMTPDNTDILFAGTAIVKNDTVFLRAEGQHLTCFVGGMFALGGKIFQSEEDVNTGIRLARGCAWAYNAFPTGIMPEIFDMIPCESLEGCIWDEEMWQARAVRKTLPRGFESARDPWYILRPEAIESVFLLYRITGLTEFQEVAWEMFQSIMKATETELCNAAIDDVTVMTSPKQRDSMESFWLAETLKYFYLIFSTPDIISLDEYVLNTEAHPFKLPK